MFEVPDAKRVRREELYDSISEEETTNDDQVNSDLRGKLNAQLSGLLDLDLEVDESTQPHQLPISPTVGANVDRSNDGDVEKTAEEAFTFRLFRDEELSRKIVLEPQGAETGKGGGDAFVVPQRPISYYLASEPSPEAAKEYRMAAVSADYLFQDAKKRRWGLEKPWRVTTITISTNKKIATPGSSIGTVETGRPKKKRPGKKRRIILRVREQAKKEREEAAKQQLMDKEQYLQEKKKRLNKAKQLRRRAKAREKKQNVTEDATSEHNRDGSLEQEQD
ncbi:hypothetical protein F5Y05DRAFT_382583 [Hypoxylon sp. FL0543]|nr:hypothetical protein F5Y05DRAFT_382583 [Hypoxylon sp. FL0543]